MVQKLIDQQKKSIIFLGPPDGKSVVPPGKAKGKGKATTPTPNGIPDVVPDKYSEVCWEMPRAESGLKLIGEDACGVPWQYIFQDESRRSFAAFLQAAMHPEQCDLYFNTVKEGTEWLQPEGKNGPIPRKTAWMVREGCECTYRYGSIQVPPQVFPPWMVELMRVSMPLAGLHDVNLWPNSCNLNLYEDGGHAVGWHSDDESLFQGKFQDIRIISLSFGAKRRFELRLNWPDVGERALHTMPLGNGDMCTMEGMLQKHCQHRVPREANIQGPRINLTWRWNVKHAPRCPVSRQRGGCCGV